MGTERGIIECRTVSRLNGDEARDTELLLKIIGVLWRPVPDREGMRILAVINTNGDVVDDDTYQPRDLEDEERDDITPTLRGGPHSLHVSRKAVAKLGATEGCAACTALKRLGHLEGKFSHNHSEACRTR